MLSLGLAVVGRCLALLSCPSIHLLLMGLHVSVCTVLFSMKPRAKQNQFMPLLHFKKAGAARGDVAFNFKTELGISAFFHLYKQL